MNRLIVSQDGSGDFTTVQVAVDAVPEAGKEPWEILIRPGVYRERVVVNRDHLRLIGEDRQRTVITWSACARDPAPDGSERGTFLSFTLLLAADDCTVENLTVRNDAGDGSVAGQAVAVYAAGDRDVWRNCDLIACQDTLFCGPLMQKVLDDIAPRTANSEIVPFVGDCPLTRSRQFFEGCFIQGDVDYIFGPYRCWFERCTLFMNARGGWYTAANTPEEQPWGMVFHDCRLTGACDRGKGWLGRPWRRFARTLFLNCEMDECVNPWGFVNWDEIRVITRRCGEWRTAGARADLSVRNPDAAVLTDEEAACVTVEAVLNGWRP